MHVAQHICTCQNVQGSDVGHQKVLGAGSQKSHEFKYSLGCTVSKNNPKGLGTQPSSRIMLPIGQALASIPSHTYHPAPLPRHKCRVV